MKLPGKSSKVWFLPPLIIAIVAVSILARNRGVPETKPPVERSRVLRVLEVETQSVIPRALGFGNASPGRVWRAVAEIKGRIIEINSELQPGAMLEANMLLLRIDSRDVELQIARIEAAMEQAKAQLAELDAQQSATKASLEIEERSLELATQALERSRELFKSGTQSQTALDSEERTALAQEQSVQSLRTKLSLMPAQRKNFEASVSVQQADLERAQLDLARAEIRTPFSCRIADVGLEVGQFLALGEPLFEAHATSLTEIEAQIPIDQVRMLIDAEASRLILPGMNMEAIRSAFDVECVVRLRTGNDPMEWTGRFDRLRESIDARTRSIGVIVAVDDPYKGAVPGKRPPFVPGMFCEVELRGKPRPDRVFLPRVAVEDSQVYVLDSDQRLTRRRVEVEFEQGAHVCIRSGLQAGELVVVSDPMPAVEGMLVRPLPDPELSSTIASSARGETRLR